MSVGLAELVQSMATEEVIEREQDLAMEERELAIKLERGLPIEKE